MPNPRNDRENAENYVKYKNHPNQSSKIHLTLSATFPNLQSPDDIMTNLYKLTRDFPEDFKWAGEMNVIKHALVGNGFFKVPFIYYVSTCRVNGELEICKAMKYAIVAYFQY